MNKIIKKYLEYFANPLLYYIDRDGNSVFRNFCLFRNTGNSYNRVIQVKEAGDILEYRIDKEKKINLLSFSFVFLIYLIFVHFIYNFWGFIFCVVTIIFFIYKTRVYYNRKFCTALINLYGQYSVVDFSPSISNEKRQEYNNNYLMKIMLVSVFILLFISFSFVLKGTIKYFVNKPEPSYGKAEITAGIYTAIYPPSPLIYEFRAYKEYSDGNFDNAVENYLKAFNIYGKRFTDKDFTRYANLLYAVKKSSGSQNAIDVFNEYTTKKKTNISQKTKLLWIKSMFSIANGVSDFVDNDYEDLLASLNPNDTLNRYYILSDEAYMLYLSRDYNKAIEIYNEIIPTATENEDIAKDLPRLYAERAYCKSALNDKAGANMDFINSQTDLSEVQKYEPKITEPGFINYKL